MQAARTTATEALDHVERLAACDHAAGLSWPQFCQREWGAIKAAGRGRRFGLTVDRLRRLWDRLDRAAAGQPAESTCLAATSHGATSHAATPPRSTFMSTIAANGHQKPAETPRNTRENERSESD